MQLRFVITSALGLAVLGLAAFYVLTIPSTLSPDVFKPRTAVLANGETMFNIGGCANCHATPGQDNRLKLGGGLGLRSSVVRLTGAGRARRHTQGQAVSSRRYVSASRVARFGVSTGRSRP